MSWEVFYLLRDVPGRSRLKDAAARQCLGLMRLLFFVFVAQQGRIVFPQCPGGRKPHVVLVTSAGSEEGRQLPACQRA